MERSVAKELENLKRKLGLRNINEVIELLIREYKARKLEHFFGVDKGRISGFKEDRVEDRC